MFSIKDITPKERIEAEQRGISYVTLASRMFNGWSKERALTEPVNSNGVKRKKKRKVSKK